MALQCVVPAEIFCKREKLHVQNTLKYNASETKQYKLVWNITEMGHSDALKTPLRFCGRYFQYCNQLIVLEACMICFFLWKWKLPGAHRIKILNNIFNCRAQAYFILKMVLRICSNEFHTHEKKNVLSKLKFYYECVNSCTNNKWRFCLRMSNVIWQTTACSPEQISDKHHIHLSIKF